MTHRSDDMLERVFNLSANASQIMAFGGLTLFIGGAWLESDIMMSIGGVSFLASAAPFAVFVTVAAIQAFAPSAHR
jgi:hypothetical protein